jgi:hypothetical protein
MPRKQEFEIYVSPDGEIKIRAIGFQGKECIEPLKQVGEIISPGTTPIREEKYSEYYQQAEEKGKIKGETKDK